MNKTSVAALALLAAVFACTASAAVEVGDQGPNYSFDKSWNLPDGASDLEAFRGKIVLVERWATWCGPCMAQIPHLQGLHDKYNDKGFQIVSTSNEEVSLIQSKMIDARKPTYGIVRADIGGTYETSGIPHCWVLDADGKCIFKGHPAKLTDAMVEEWIKTLPPSTIDREIANELKGAVKAFNDGKFGKAMVEVAKATAENEDPLVAEDAKFINDLLQKRVDGLAKKISKAKEAGDMVGQSKALGEAAEQFDGSEQGDAWANELKELEKSKEFKDTLKSQEELDKIKPKLEDMRASSARKALEKIAKKYPDTAAGKEAAELAKRYEE